MEVSGRRPIASEALGPTITVGEILVEIMAATRGTGFLEPQTFSGPYPSGAPAIFISQVARLGGGAGIVACVGEDDFGALNIARLKDDGADVSAVAVSPDRPTGSAFVRYHTDGGRDFIFNISASAAGQLSLTSGARALADRAGHLHVMGSAFAIPGAGEVIAYAIAAVRRRGGSISLDPNIRKELLTGKGAMAGFGAAVKAADVILPSGGELHAIAGADCEDEAVSRLIANGVSEIVLKRGAGGSAYFGAGGKRLECPAFAVDETDPTGAGDCFGAAYVTCRRLGMPPETALLYANAAGARNVTFQGPMGGVGTFADLDLFIERTPRREP